MALAKGFFLILKCATITHNQNLSGNTAKRSLLFCCKTESAARNHFFLM